MLIRQKNLMSFGLVILLGLSMATMCSAQKDTTSNGLDGAMVPAKILAARHEFNSNNMRGALNLYREVLSSDSRNASALYGTAQCHYYLKKYPLALDYLRKAVANNSSVASDLFIGQIYHRTAQLDSAIFYYTKFSRSVGKNSSEYIDAQEYIAQCLFAKELMTRPASVDITNLGDAINSRFDDYTPSITADGKRLVFTARRSDTTKWTDEDNGIDEKGDYKFFEDIYVSDFDEATGEWGQALKAEGKINTPLYDAVLSIFPDGSGMYVYRNTVTTTGDIYVSKYNKASNEWREAEKMDRPINTSYFESSVSMTADGSMIYFISERPEGMGQGDIYYSVKKGDKWSNAKNLGKVINTNGDEKFVFIHPNGKTLYFSSNGHPGMGSYDIFKTELVNNEWSVPVNVGYPINTVNEESTFSLTSDNKTLYIAAEYEKGFGERDIYKIDLSNYPMLSSGYETGSFGQVICTVADTKGEFIKGATVKIYNTITGKMVTEVRTDKLGRAKISLQADQNYKAEIILDDMVKSEIFELPMTKAGPTIHKIDVVF
jgi:tetratricopeptide (TPR) repeat protein